MPSWHPRRLRALLLRGLEQGPGGSQGALHAPAALDRSLGFLPAPARHAQLLLKDLKVFLRDTAQWSQLLLLLALALVYVYNFRVLDLDRIPYMSGTIKNVYAFVNLSMAAFVLSAVAVRFVFPAVSAEGARFWIVRSSPVSMRAFLWSKFWTGLPARARPRRGPHHRLQPAPGRGSVLKVPDRRGDLRMCFALVGLAAGLGARYPRFWRREHHPGRRAPSAGVAFMVLAVLFIMVVVGLLAWPASTYLWFELRGQAIPGGRVAGALACLGAAATLCASSAGFPCAKEFAPSRPSAEPRLVGLGGLCYDPCLMKRNPTRTVRIGTIAVGAGHPVVVQSMCATRTQDIDATVEQAESIRAAGAGLVRVAVDSAADVEALKEVRRQTSANLVVDLQENYRLAATVAPHVHKVRYNPGHLYHHEKEKPVRDKVRFLAEVAREHDLALRVGVNCGSVDPEVKAQNPGDDVAAMVSSALDHCRILDDLGFSRYVVSLKDSHPRKVIEANTRFAAVRPDVPLHLGVTEAGIPPEGIIKTRVAFEQLAFTRDRRHPAREPHPAEPAEVRGSGGGSADPGGHRRRALPLGARLRRRQAQHHLLPFLLAGREREVRGAGPGGQGDDGLRRSRTPSPSR